MRTPLRVLAGRAPQRLLMLLVRAYRLLLKPWVGSVCRFEPSCSAYALQALQRHGALAGTALAAGRILRCHPWCAAGHDPVPENLRGWAAGALLRARPFNLFTRLGLGSTAADAPSLTRKPP